MHIRDAEPWTGESEFHSLEAGIFRHMRADAYFHNAEFFMKEQSYFRMALSENLPKDLGLKFSFLGHVLFEMMLDRQIIQHEPEFLERYYNSLSKISEEKVLEYTQLRGFEGESEAFFRYFRGFKESQFLYRYESAEGLATGLRRICKMATGVEIPSELNSKLAELIEQLDNHLEPTWKEYLMEVRQNIEDAG